MIKTLSLALIAGGILFVVLGINASNALSSDVDHFITGSPAYKAIWMLAGGVVVAAVGLVGLMYVSRRG